MKASAKTNTAITCMFLDIGGVLLTNGWDHLARRRVAKHFKLKWAEMEDRHNLNFATYDEGKLTLSHGSRHSNGRRLELPHSPNQLDERIQP
jgi:hypothetical protein